MPIEGEQLQDRPFIPIYAKTLFALLPANGQLKAEGIQQLNDTHGNSTSGASEQLRHARPANAQAISERLVGEMLLRHHLPHSTSEFSLDIVGSHPLQPAGTEADVTDSVSKRPAPTYTESMPHDLSALAPFDSMQDTPVVSRHHQVMQILNESGIWPAIPTTESLQAEAELYQLIEDWDE